MVRQFAAQDPAFFALQVVPSRRQSDRGEVDGHEGVERVPDGVLESDRPVASVVEVLEEVDVVVEDDVVRGRIPIEAGRRGRRLNNERQTEALIQLLIEPANSQALRRAAEAIDPETRSI